MGEGQVDNTREATGAWTTSNVGTDRSINADGNVAEIGDGLTTLIEDLKTLGVIS